MRIIARLDIKAPNLVKGICFEGLKKLGSPFSFAEDYYNQGIDEILYTDIVASLYERNGIHDLVTKTVEKVFVPITVGGGLRTIDDVNMMLRAGADKVSINTQAIKNISFLKDLSKIYGSQCITLSVQAKRLNNGTWEAFYDNGREKSGVNILDYILEAQENNIGEIILTSIDKDGTLKGLDIDMIESVAGVAKVPLVCGGGFNDLSELKLLNNLNVSGICIGSALHYKKLTITEIRKYCNKNGIKIRKIKTNEN